MIKNLYLSKASLHFIFFIILLVCTNSLKAQDPGELACGCDYTLPRSGDGGIYFINGSNGINVLPGKKVCIQAGVYPYISLNGLVGTAAEPITIINCGGQVISGQGSSYAYNIIKSRYFRFTGTGDENTLYGFKADGVVEYTPSALSIRDSTGDYEIDHLEAVRVQIGIFAKINPADCDPGSWNNGWTIKNISFHDNYIHNIHGEGFYLGHTAATIDIMDCNGNSLTVEPVKINGIKVYDNITDSTGWDGIQVAASQNAEIYGNKVKNYGMENRGSQQAGIILGGKSFGKVYNNYVNKGSGNGIQLFGSGNIEVYNNVVIDAGWDSTNARQDAILVDDRPQPNNIYTGLQIYLMNNTIVNSGRNAIHIYNTYGTMAIGNKVYNNLLVQPNGTNTYDNQYTNIADTLDVRIENNISKENIRQALFVNADANNFHLLNNSPAIDAGRNLSAEGVLTDIEGLSRTQGSAYDAGAYEFKTSALPVTLLNFSASNDNDKNVLQWKSGTEVNTNFFIIERSTNGQTFINVGKSLVKNSTEVNAKNYVFIDEKPIKGTNYYRLAIHDKDGTVAYSKIILVLANSINNFTINHLELSAKTNNFKLMVNSNFQETATVNVVDVNGRIVFTTSAILQNGLNTINKFIPALHNGVYYVKIFTRDKMALKQSFAKIE